ncbi:MAG TPA: hypoxanthine phosphoribosyltransferase [Bacteroidales bacterium]|nr:hypoxanthine phosphoribosyltransferase [Bacteroidales bacterium]
MTKVQVRELVFEKFIPREEIDAAVQRVAEGINRDFEGKNPLLLAILNGAFMFAGDLMRKITVPCEITFVKFASYSGTRTTEVVRELIGVDEELAGRHVIIVEDIVDTGITIEKLLAEVSKQQPADVKVACFCFKAEAFQKDFPIDYIGISIPNDFIVGYGLDYNGYGRNLPEIYKIVK